MATTQNLMAPTQHDLQPQVWFGQYDSRNYKQKQDLTKGWDKITWVFGNARLGGGDPVTSLSNALHLQIFHVTIRTNCMTKRKL